MCANYVELDQAELRDGMWNATLKDTDTGATYTCKAKVIINAAGPYVDQVNEAHEIRTDHKIVFSKGIHLIVPRIANSERVLAFFDDTQRLFYVIPMGPRSVIRTTDERVVDPETRERRGPDFLLEQINERLALAEPLTSADIISSRSGVRPLVVDAGGGDAENADWTSLSRKHAMEVDAGANWITIFGGKLTDCVNVGHEV